MVDPSRLPEMFPCVRHGRAPIVDEGLTVTRVGCPVEPCLSIWRDTPREAIELWNRLNRKEDRR